MIINTLEARKVFQKKADALCRQYSKKPKFDGGDKITLSVERDGKLEAFAYCTVRSVRQVTEDDYQGPKSDYFVGGEGWSSFRVWKRENEKLYGSPLKNLWRITFNVDKLHSEVVADEAKRQENARKDRTKFDFPDR